MPLRLSYNPNPKDSGIQILTMMGNEDPLPWRGVLTDRSQQPLAGYEDRRFDMFSQINGYWNTLSRDRQVAIFNKIREIHFILNEVFDTQELVHSLQDPIAELIGMHDFEAVRWYLLMHSGVIIPSTVHDAYQGAEQQPGSRAQTYLRSEYEDLITLSVILRAMYPIFITFVSKVSRTVGNDRKEFFAFSLLGKSYLMNHRSMDRVREYIDGCTARRPQLDLQQVFSGVSSEDRADYILADAVVRRICCCDVRGTGVNGVPGVSGGSLNPTQVLWQVVSSFLSDRGAHSSSRYCLKQPHESGGGEDGGQAHLEAQKVSSELSMSTISIMQHSAGDIYRLAKRFDATIPDETIATFDECTRKSMADGTIPDATILLTKWVMGVLINPTAIDLMYRQDVINCITVTRTVLWHRGFYELAGIIGSKPMDNGDDLVINAISSRSRIPQATIEKMLELYSSFVPRSMTSLEDRVKWMRSSDIMQSISHVGSICARNEWILQLPPEWVKMITGNPNDTVLSPSIEMVGMLCKLLEEIDSWGELSLCN